MPATAQIAPARLCPHCGEPFAPLMPRRIYCTRACLARATWKRKLAARKSPTRSCK